MNAPDLHSAAFVIDAHADYLMDVRQRRREQETAVLHRQYLPEWRAGGINAVVFAIFVQAHLREGILREALLMVDDLHQEIAETAGALQLIRTVDDLKGIPADSVAALLSLEGTEALAADMGILRLLFDLGLRSVGLTWFGRTMAADGTGEEESGGGLTSFGKDLVRECNRLGILVDVSHLSERGFWDVMRVAQGPVIASHSNARTICEHPRNLRDEQLRAIAESGGAVGLNSYHAFVDPVHPTVDRLLDHAAHMDDIMGQGHVGLGLDLVDYVPQFKGHGTIGLEDASKTSVITEQLLQRGAHSDAIRGLLGENWLRVWRHVLPGGAR